MFLLGGEVPPGSPGGVLVIATLTALDGGDRLPLYLSRGVSSSSVAWASTQSSVLGAGAGHQLSPSRSV